MGETYADLTLKNLFGGASVRVRALVDTGSSYMIVTPAVASALGFDTTELMVRNVTLADNRRIPAPVAGPLEILFEDRRCALEAVVLGGAECLMGFIPLEAMDLIVDPIRQRVIGAHEGGPLIRV